MPDLHALLVGIDRYRPDRLPDGALVHDLQGCVRDVERMADFLRRGPLAVPEERIRILVSPLCWDRQEPAPEELPTYRNLICEIGALAARAKPGDHVLIHFSGHGAVLPTAVPEKKGRDGIDECLVPCDAGAAREAGGGFLRDVELHALLTRLAERGLRVALVLDCCHSGGVTRALGRVRGLGRVAAPPGAPGPLGDWEELGAVLPEPPEVPPRDRFRHLEGVAGWFPQPDGCVLLAACLPTEYAREHPFEDGRWSGALTHFFLEAVNDLGRRPTYRWLHHRLLGRIRGLFEQQTPVLEGDGDVAFLGSERWPARRGVPVLEIAGGAGGPRVLLGAGRAQGLGCGARLEIRADGGEGECLAELEVTDTAATSSWAKATPVSPSSVALAPGELAAVVDPGPDSRRYRVGTLAQAGIGWEHRRALERVHETLTSAAGSLLVPVQGRSDADFLVEVMPGGVYRLLDPSGEPVPHQGEAIAVGDDGAAEKLVDRLDHLARFRAVEDLDNPDASSPLFGRLHAELFALDRMEDWQTLGFRVPVGACSVPTGTFLCLLLHNESARELNVAVLDLEPDWGISRAHPHPNEGAYTTLRPGAERPVHLRACLPDWMDHGRDRLKVVAATGPLDASHLEIPALGESVGYRSGRGSGPGPAPGLRTRLLAPRQSAGVLRGLEPVAPASHDWTVVTVEVQVVREVGTASGGAARYRGPGSEWQAHG